MSASRKTTKKQTVKKRVTAFYAFVITIVLIVILFSLTGVKKVYPIAPTITVSSECGVEPKLSIPIVEGVIYHESRIGDKLTITAEPVSNEYRITDGTQKSWEFGMGSVSCNVDSKDVEDNRALEDNPESKEFEILDVFTKASEDLANEALSWAKEYGSDIWEKTKDASLDAKVSVEKWVNTNLM